MQNEFINHERPKDYEVPEELEAELQEKVSDIDQKGYEEYLGTGYRDRVRSMISVDDKLLPDRIIDADLSIGTMKQLIAPVLENMRLCGRFVNTEKKYKQLNDAALNYLCGVLCVALKSRTSAPPYDTPENKRNWDKKREKFMRYGNSMMMGLIRMG